MRRFCLPLLIAAVSGLAALSAAGQASARHATPAFRDRAAAASELAGVWRSQGYGLLAEFGEGAPVIYHLAGQLCQRDTGTDLGELFAKVRFPKAGVAEFTPAPNETRYRFTRLTRLPPACKTAPPPPGTFIAASFAELYPGFGPRKIRRKAFLASLRAADALPEAQRFDAIAAALGPLSDAHVELEYSGGGAERSFKSGEASFLSGLADDARYGEDRARRERTWLMGYRQQVIALLGPGGKQGANNRIFWGRVGGLGYINVVTMGGFEDKPDATAALDAALDDALRSFAGLPGVIVDVSNNRGGYDAISRRIAARFAARPAQAFSKRPYGSSAPWQSFSVAPPNGGVTYTGRVWLLTSEITVSAGESFTLAMRALPNVTHIGQPTRGDLSDKLPKQLPNGWVFALPAEVYRDSRGREWEGLGIQPQVSYPVPLHDHAATVKALAADIEAKRL